MKPSGDIFALIRSLTKTEKRHFKLYARRHSNAQMPVSITLFEAIERQGFYDEDLILAQFRAQDWTRHFAKNKFQLYELILDSLHAFYRNNESKQQVRKLLHYSELLSIKQLPQQALDMLKKAEKIARKNEHFSYLIEIAILRETLRAATVRPEKFDTKEGHQIIDYLENYFDYFAHSRNVFYIIRRSGQTLSPKAAHEMKRIVDLPFFADISNAKTDYAKRVYHYVNKVYYHSTGDYETSLKYSEAHMKLAETSKTSGVLGSYMMPLLSYINLCFAAKKYEPATLWLEKFAALSDDPRATLSDHIFIFENTCMMRLQLAFAAGEFKKGLAYIPLIKKESETRFKDKATYDFSIASRFLYTQFYIVEEQYSEALSVIGEFFSLIKPNYRTDLQTSMLLMRLIASFDLNDVTLLESTVRSVYRSLQQVRKMTRFEKILFRFVHDAQRLADQKKFDFRFEKLYRQCVDLASTPTEAQTLTAFPFIGWLRSKIENRKLREVLLDKR